MQPADLRNPYRRNGRSLSQVDPGYGEGGKRRENGDGVRVGGSSRGEMTVLDKLNFLGVIPLGIASVRARTAKLRAARMTPVMARMSNHARMHVARHSRAERAEDCQGHL